MFGQKKKKLYGAAAAAAKRRKLTDKLLRGGNLSLTELNLLSDAQKTSKTGARVLAGRSAFLLSQLYRSLALAQLALTLAATPQSSVPRRNMDLTMKTWRVCRIRSAKHQPGHTSAGMWTTSSRPPKRRSVPQLRDRPPARILTPVLRELTPKLRAWLQPGCKEHAV